MINGPEDSFSLQTLSTSLSSYDSSSRGSWSSVMTASTGANQTNFEDNRLRDILKRYIVYRCTLNEFCCENDFDEAALEALLNLPFLQGLQTIEQYSSNVSKKVAKKSAYLMGILFGQKNQWNKNMVGTVTSGNSIELSDALLQYIGNCCLHGNCLPSDFTPEICTRLQQMTPGLASKAVGAFNSNKRIVAGPKGGVINRSRFFLRLIQNVAEQSKPTPMRCAPSTGNICSRTQAHQDYEFCQIEDTRLKQEQRIRELERDILVRQQREQHLLHQMAELKVRLYHLQDEYQQLQRKSETNKDVLNFTFFD